MRLLGAVPLVALVLIPRTAWPQGTPLGPEFRVNTYTTGLQAVPSVAADASGNFVVVWNSIQDPGYGVFGQRYASSGAPLGLEFRVNTYTTGAQEAPAVAADASGNFVVVWTSSQDGSGYGVFGQRYASSGTPLGPEFRVNTYTTNGQAEAVVASDPSGNFVVVWSSGQDGDGYGVFGQRYASSGTPLGPEFRVNTSTAYNQYGPSVATDPTTGNFVVVWTSVDVVGSSYGVFGQRYANSGVPLGPEFRVNTYTTYDQYRASVTADATGNFVVVWSSYEDGSGYGVFGQRYLGSGAPLGAEFRVNTFLTFDQVRPHVAADSSGDFVVIWQSDGQDGSGFGVFGQRFASSGAMLGPEFRVNTYTTSAQSRASVAADPVGNFVVVWQSSTQDGSSFGAYGQRYGQIVPAELTSFRIE
jgi:hypothetical protein